MPASQHPLQTYKGETLYTSILLAPPNPLSTYKTHSFTLFMSLRKCCLIWEKPFLTTISRTTAPLLHVIVCPPTLLFYSSRHNKAWYVTACLFFIPTPSKMYVPWRQELLFLVHLLNHSRCSRKIYWKAERFKWTGLLFLAIRGTRIFWPSWLLKNM